MHTLESELRAAREALAFWQSFTHWWGERHDGATEPRVFEMLSHAEQRCARAEQALLQMQCVGTVN